MFIKGPGTPQNHKRILQLSNLPPKVLYEPGGFIRILGEDTEKVIFAILKGDLGRDSPLKMTGGLSRLN